MSEVRPRPLEGIRVAEFAQNAAVPHCGRILAGMGADVVKVEPPGGCEARFAPPFAPGGRGDPESSLFWRAFGLGKKSVVLDLAGEDDRARFLEEGIESVDNLAHHDLIELMLSTRVLIHRLIDQPTIRLE